MTTNPPPDARNARIYVATANVAVMDILSGRGSLRVQNGHSDYLAGIARSGGRRCRWRSATGVVFAVVLAYWQPAALSWAMSSRLAARAAARSWSRSPDLETQVDDLLLEDLVVLLERVGIGGCAEPGFMPGVFAEQDGEAAFELLDAGGEARWLAAGR